MWPLVCVALHMAVKIGTPRAGVATQLTLEGLLHTWHRQTTHEIRTSFTGPRPTSIHNKLNTKKNNNNPDGFCLKVNVRSLYGYKSEPTYFTYFKGAESKGSQAKFSGFDHLICI